MFNCKYAEVEHPNLCTYYSDSRPNLSGVLLRRMEQKVSRKLTGPLRPVESQTTVVEIGMTKKQYP